MRAKVVAAEELGEFRWSSFWWFPQKKDRPAWLCAETILAEAGNLTDSPAGWRRYRDYLTLLDEAEPTKRGERYGKLSRGWAVGTGEFKQELIAELRQQGAELERAVLHGESKDDWRDLRERTWEERLVRFAKAAKVDLNNLGAKKSDSGKVSLAAAMRSATAASNGWLARRLQMGAAGGVSQSVRRWLQVPENEQRLAQVIAQVV